MKRFLFVVAIVLTALQMSAANVDLAHATAIAKRCINGKANATVLQNTSTNSLKLIHTEVNSSNAIQAAYYIFNYDKGFVIVSGDDRAHQILAHGDRPLDMKRMPENMKFWLSTYKKQIEYLQAHPGMVVDSPSLNRSLRTPDVAPLLTAEWDQMDPYCFHCPPKSRVISAAVAKATFPHCRLPSLTGTTCLTDIQAITPPNRPMP